MDINEELENKDETEVSEAIDSPIFVCHTVLDGNAQEEIMKIALGKKAMGTDVVIYSMCILLSGYMIADSILNHAWSRHALWLGVMVILAILTFVLRKNAPKRAVKYWEESIIKQYSTSALHTTTEFYNRSLAQSIEEDEDQIIVDGYSSIEKMTETENYFLLHYGNSRAYVVAKKGFEGNTEEQFRTFITERIGGK